MVVDPKGPKKSRPNCEDDPLVMYGDGSKEAFIAKAGDGDSPPMPVREIPWGPRSTELDYARAMIKLQRGLDKALADLAQMKQLCRLLNKINAEAEISICEDVPSPGLGLDYSYVRLSSDEIELWRWATADVD